MINLYEDPGAAKKLLAGFQMVVAATGHRLDKVTGAGKGIYDDPALTARAYRGMMNAAIPVLEGVGADCVLVGMAIGWDLAVAMAAFEMGIPFVACVPFRGQEGRWGAREQARWSGAMERAFARVVVCPGGYSAKKMMDRNSMMVNHSSGYLLALWDGSSGGTAHTVRAGERRGLVLRNAWDDYRAGSAALFE